MVKRRVRSKSKSRSIQLKKRSRRPGRTRYSYSSTFSAFDKFLDRNVSVRSLLKYSSITVAFILVLAFVFMLGRLSVDASGSMDSAGESVQLAGQTSQVMKSGAADNDDSSVGDATGEETEEDVSDIGEMNLSDPEDDAEASEEGTENEGSDNVEGKKADEESGEDVEESECSLKHAEFDYTYRLVDISVSNFNKEVRGENWATVTALKLTITNNEHCTIINPAQIKIKLNNRGKGSVWWDDEVFLPKSFLGMKPGETVSEIVPVHVSYSDIYSEKDFRLTVFDEYGIEIGTFKDYITLS